MIRIKPTPAQQAALALLLAKDAARKAAVISFRSFSETT